MKLLKKVPTVEVKRCFVISDLINRVTVISKNGRKKMSRKKSGRIAPDISRQEIEKKFNAVRARVLKFNEAKLDKIIEDGYAKRLKAYDESQWHVAEVSPPEVGVWKRAGGLPLSWTNGSLAETAEKVRHALEKNPKLLVKRARRTIPNMLRTGVADFQKEKYLLPIIFKGGTGTRGRRGLKRKMKGDIDDGCMRSVALAMSGVKTIRAYFGVPKPLVKSA